MNPSPANLDFIFVGFDARFQSTYNAAPTYYQRFTTVVPSSTRTQRYGWLDRIPRARLWVGERQIQNISARSYSLDNQDYELTMEVDRNVILDDQVGLYANHVDAMAFQAKLWPDQLMVPTLTTGDTSAFPCHDGQNFFSANHPVDIDNPASPVLSNLFSGGGTSTLNMANFATIYARMTEFRASDNRPYGVMPDLMIVPPQQQFAARQILFGTIIAPTVAIGANAAAAPQTNILLGMTNLLVHPYLAGAYPGGSDLAWYLIDSSKPVKPFVFQLRQAPIFVYKNNPSDIAVFFRRKFLYGWDARGAAGVSLWFLAAKAAGT